MFAKVITTAAVGVAILGVTACGNSGPTARTLAAKQCAQDARDQRAWAIKYAASLPNPIGQAWIDKLASVNGFPVIVTFNHKRYLFTCQGAG